MKKFYNLPKPIFILTLLVLCFSKINAGTIDLTYPAGGEILKASQANAITWTSSEIAFVNIEYFENGTWYPIGKNIDATSGTFNWTVPYIVSDNDVKVRITDAGDAATFDESGTFSVEIYNQIKITSQAGGETYTDQDVINITWTTEYISSTTLIIYFSQDNGANWVGIGSGNSGTLYGLGIISPIIFMAPMQRHLPLLHQHPVLFL